MSYFNIDQPGRGMNNSRVIDAACLRGIAMQESVPTAQVETATVVAASGATGNGDLPVTVTGADILGSPLTINVPLTTAANSASLVATEIRAALAANSAVAARYTVGGSAANVVLTRTVPTDNDATLSVSWTNVLGISALAASVNTTAGVGTAGKAVPCQPNGVFLGFTYREVKAGGPSLADITFSGRLELPAETGLGVSIVPGDLVTVEGSDYILASGTGALTAANIASKPPATTYANFVDGKFREAQSNERVEYVLEAKLDPVEAGQVRLRFRKI